MPSGGGQPGSYNPVFPLGAKTFNATVDVSGLRSFLKKVRGANSLGSTPAMLAPGDGKRAAFWYPGFGSGGGGVPDLDKLDDKVAARHPQLRCMRGEFAFAMRVPYYCKGKDILACVPTRRATMAGHGGGKGSGRPSQVCRPVFTNLGFLPKVHDDPVIARNRLRDRLDPMGVVPDVQSTASTDGNFTVQYDGLETPTNNSDLNIIEGDDVEIYLPLPSKLRNGGGTDEQRLGQRPIAWYRPVRREQRDMFAYDNYFKAAGLIKAGLEAFRAKLGADFKPTMVYDETPALSTAAKGPWVYEFEEDWVQYWFVYFQGDAMQSIWDESDDTAAGGALADFNRRKNPADVVARVIERCEYALITPPAVFVATVGTKLQGLRDSNMDGDRWVIGKALSTGASGQSFDMIHRRQGF